MNLCNSFFSLPRQKVFNILFIVLKEVFCPFVKTNKHGHGTDVQVPKGSSPDVKAKLAQIAAAAVAANNADLGEEEQEE